MQAPKIPKSPQNFVMARQVCWGIGGAIELWITHKSVCGPIEISTAVGEGNKGNGGLNHRFILFAVTFPVAARNYILIEMSDE